MRCFVRNLTPRLGRTACAVGAAWLLAGASAHAALLYDGSLSTRPASQGWAFAALGAATQTMANGAVSLDTSLVNATQAGYSRILPPIDSAAGFTLSFKTQLLSESHTGNGNRAGFSVILLDGSHSGVELGFWTNQVWAQATDFTKAEAVAFTTTAMTEYWLTVSAGHYFLTANGLANPLLSGVMRDYSSSSIVPVYSTNNFLFLGDDTSSAKARVNIAAVSTVPLPPTWVLMLGPALAWTFKARREGAHG